MHNSSHTFRKLRSLWFPVSPFRSLAEGWWSLHHVAELRPVHAAQERLWSLSRFLGSPYKRFLFPSYLARTSPHCRVTSQNS